MMIGANDARNKIERRKSKLRAYSNFATNNEEELVRCHFSLDDRVRDDIKQRTYADEGPLSFYFQCADPSSQPTRHGYVDDIPILSRACVVGVLGKAGYVMLSKSTSCESCAKECIEECAHWFENPLHGIRHHFRFTYPSEEDNKKQKRMRRLELWRQQRKSAEK